MRKNDGEIGGEVDFVNLPPPGFINKFVRTAVLAIVGGALFYAGLLEYEKVLDAGNTERITEYGEVVSETRSAELDAIDRLPPGVREARMRSLERRELAGQ